MTAAELEIISLSVKVAAVATIASAIPAVGVAWILARSRVWGRSALNVLVHLPLVVPLDRCIADRRVHDVVLSV